MMNPRPERRRPANRANLLDRARRAILATICVGLAAGLGLPGTTLPGEGLSGPGPLSAQEAEYETSEVAPGVYRFRWRSHNGFFVVGGAEVVVIDPISTEAAAVLASEIGRVAPGSRPAAVVYSHHHADHATGATALLDAMDASAPIIAHENAAAPLIEAASPDQPPPTVTFSRRATVMAGDRAVELHYLGRSHSDNMAVALVPDARVAFAVDFISRDRVGYRDLPGWYFPDHFRALSRLLDLEFDVIVFGHGPNGDRASVIRQIAYYDDLRGAVAEAIAAGLSEDEAAERVRLPAYEGWDGYANWFPLNVRGMYRWLAGREPKG